MIAKMRTLLSVFYAYMLEYRAELQRRIDAWHRENPRRPDPAAYRAFLEEIGYLVPEGPDFRVETARVDPEIAAVPGPQLVVPITNARYALNAANARWGSLYDALYGTDALGDLPAGRGYDPARGQRVIAWAMAFLDEAAPLVRGSHAEVTRYAIAHGRLVPMLADGPHTGQVRVGYVGAGTGPRLARADLADFMLKLAADGAHVREAPVISN